MAGKGLEKLILLVDDQVDLLRGLQRIISREFSDVGVVTTVDPEEALEIVSSKFVSLVLLDIQMPEMSGFELLSRMQVADRQITVIMMTGYGSIETAVEAIRSGAYDFVTKPFDNVSMFRVLRKGLEHNRLLRENVNLKRRVIEQDSFADFIGDSRCMQRLYHGINTAAKTDYTVLIRGGSGTGKELVAKALHSLGKRRDKPLVMVNCPAIPEHLIESELFGHVRGAFTGADQFHKGLFAEADGGTICLDEIGDIPLAVQAKLLRVLQEHEVKPVGSNATRYVDVRIIGSTNRNLEQLIKEGAFREDLFFRLNVVSLHTPSLNEIREDIPLLINYFSRKVCKELELPWKQFSMAAVEELSTRSWPGNVRELQNVIRSAILFCPHEIIPVRYVCSNDASNISDKQQQIIDSELEPYKDAKDKTIASFTLEYVDKLLRKANGNVSRAAEMSGLSRGALQKIMRRHDIKSEDFRK